MHTVTTPNLPANLALLGITRVVALDFETYYNTADGYSLAAKQMTTEKYVRDHRYQTICVTATVDGQQIYEAWGHYDARQLLINLGVERKDTVTVAHNARFDGCVAEMALELKINMLVCTIHMMRITGLSRFIGESLRSLAEYLSQKGYPIPAKGYEVENANGLRLEDMTLPFRKRYIQYCRTDTQILYTAAMLLLPECPPDTLRASNMTLKMYTRPRILLDKSILKNYMTRLIQRREETMMSMAREHGCMTIPDFIKLLRSPKQFVELLRKLGVEPPMKVSEKKTATKQANLLDPQWVEKRKTPKFLALLAEQGDTWESWAAAPVMDYALSKKDVEFIELADHPDERVSAIVNARLENNSSQAETRTKTFMECAERGPLVFALQYAVARTHRYGADDRLNQQNLPKHTGDRTLRLSMKAPPGYEIGGADSSQIEARCLAYAAQETKLLSIFETGGDPYSYMAEIIYNVPAAEINHWAKMDGHVIKTLSDDDKRLQAKRFFMRFMGKKTVLGSGYQMSGNTFAQTLRQDKIMLKPTKEHVMAWLRTQPKSAINNHEILRIAFDAFQQDFHLKEAARINWTYRSQHYRIKEFWETCDWVLAKMCQGEQGYFGGPDGELFFFDGNHHVFGERVPGIRLPNNEWLVYPELETYRDEDTGYTKYCFSERKGRTFIRKHIYGGSLTENLIQALAFTILTWQAVRIHQVVPVIGNVHDEWISIYPKEKRSNVEAVYTRAMKTVPPFVPGLPLDCEFSAGLSYGDL